MAEVLLPKVFHQIWLGDKPLPDHFKRWADAWVSMNPGWRMEWWTDERMPPLINKSEFEQAEKMAAKSDILRYELLAQFGGIYLDSDMQPLRPIGELLGGVNAFYGDERPDTPCNAIIGSVAGDPFYKAVVAALPESWRGAGDIVDKTGPRFLKRVIEQVFGADRVVEHDVCIRRRSRIRQKSGPGQLWFYDWRLFYPYYYTEEHRSGDNFPEAYGAHHWTASWWKDGGV